MLFENPGKKLKTLANVFFWIGCILTTIGQVILLVLSAESADTLILGLLGFVFLTPLLWFFQWYICLILYALGQLVDNSDDIADDTYIISKAFRPVPQEKQETKICLSSAGETPKRHGDAFGAKPMSYMHYNNEE